MPTADTDYFDAGRIVGIHGLRGDLKVVPHSGDPDALLSASRVRLVPPGKPAAGYSVVNSRLHKGKVLLRLEGLDHISKVETLVGAHLHLAFDVLPALDEGEHYWYQLEGMTVVDRTHGRVGTLAHYFTTAAHDTWVIEGPYGEVMMPAVSAFIVEIDEQGKTISVDLPQGLIEVDDL